VNTRDAARRWAETWERGWNEHDGAAILALYAEGAVWSQAPFREREAPRDYLERVFTEEASAQASFEEPLVDGDRAAVAWRGDTKLQDGGEEHLVGVSLLRFDDDGRVVWQRDVWMGG
jgi:nuclear transport factor 2 (NTF2) superfamily protein